MGWFVCALNVLSCKVSFASGFVDNFLLYSGISAKKMRTTLACLLTSVCIAHVL